MIMAKRYNGVPVCCEECGKLLGYCTYDDSPVNYVWCEECEAEKVDKDEE